jgi:beta-galactosidase
MSIPPLEADRRQAILLAGSAALVPVAAPSETPDQALRLGLGRAQPFDAGWRFHRGGGAGLESPALDDGGWRIVDLPHDWSIEDIPGGRSPGQLGPFDKSAIGGTATGFTVGGEGWYRKRFRLAALPADSRVEILFDGVSVESEVWLNGRPLGRHVHGYTPFGFDLTPHLDRGGDNLLAVRTMNLGKNSRWYAGSGLYRQVRLDVMPSSLRIARWGVAAWTRKLSGGGAEIDLTTQIDGIRAGVSLVSRLIATDGKIVAEVTDPAEPTVRQTLKIRSAQLWSTERPYLYRLESELRERGETVDRTSEPFGIRIITIDATRGMQINGEPIRLRGGCIHHDNGLLGSAAFADADERRVRLLKARGFNAIRSAHNPMSRTLREACDKLGMLAIDEAFDAWHVAKLPDDYSTHFAADWQNALSALVLSARNSPSVFLWSIGNEIPDRSTPTGLEWCWKLANRVRELDPTRPVTAALNGVLGPPVAPSPETARPGRGGVEDETSTVFLDLAGYNYRLDEIEEDHRRHPDRVIYASETFPQDVFAYARMAERLPYMLGEFVWTAIDYVGEAGIGAAVTISPKTLYYLAQYPWVNAWCGDLDLIGEQKPQSLARDAAWGISPLEMVVQRPVPEGKKAYVSSWGWADELPSWTWPDAVGRTMTVRVFSRADRIELILNGVSIATAPVPPEKMTVEFSVPYRPGTLEARAISNGVEIGRRVLRTVGPPARLALSSARTARSAADGLVYLRIDVRDALDQRVPEAIEPVDVRIEGPARLVGFGSANPFALGSFQSPATKTFHGQALLILRAQGRGTIGVEARSGALRPASRTVRLV